jgi:hypothetical protein
VTIMMARIQIALDPETHRRVRARAAQMGVSFAEYIRRLVARDLGEPATGSDPSAVFDLGRSGKSRIAADKDEMIGEAVAAERARKPYRTDR